MDYSASSGSISGGAGGTMNGWDAKEGTTAPRGGPGMSMTENGSDGSSTFATLTEGNITIGGKQTSAAELGINTDASGAHRALEALPDASKLLADQQAMAAAAGTVMATSQQIAWDIGSADAKKITDKYREPMSPEERRAFDALPSDEQFKRLVAFDASYPDALVTQQKWAPDGVYGRALGAVTSALVGGVEGQGLGQLGSSALAPYAAELIGKTFDPNKQSAVPSEAMQMLSHALLGALLAEANGGKAGSGALAAGGGELAAKVLGDYYARQNGGQLSPEQEQKIKVLGQAVGAMAGGIGGDGAMGAALGATIAKNSVENNYLNHAERMQFLDAMLSCTKSGERCGEKEELAALSDARNSALIAACTGAANSSACQAEKSKLGDAYWTLAQGESVYTQWIKDNGLALAEAALTKGNGGKIASDLLTHTSSIDAKYKITCAAAGRCDPFTAGALVLDGRMQEAMTNFAINLLFDKAGAAAGVTTNAGGMVMDVAKMNQIYATVESFKQAKHDYDRALEIGGWGLVKEKGIGAWSSITGYFGNGWDAATYELGLNQKWNLADVAGNGFTKGDMGLDAALAVVSLGDITAIRAAAKARTLAALEREAASGAGKPKSPVDMGERRPKNDYLNEVEASKTPAELIEQQRGTAGRTAPVDYEHILDGNLNARGDGVGGHYLRSDNVRVVEVTMGPDRKGITRGMVEIRDPATGKWVAKRAETTFFPREWTRRRVEMEIESAFAKSSTKYRNGQPYWEGTSSSGVKIEGYYTRPDGGAATAYPVYGAK